MLIVALVLAVIGLAALVTAVVTSNELIAWVCIGASVVGVLLLIVDAVRERSRGTRSPGADDQDDQDETATTVLPATEDYPDDPATETTETSDPSATSDLDTAGAETETVAVSTESSGDWGTDDKRD